MPDVIVIDGYVYLGDPSHPGLGQHLYDALQGRAAVVGVAKTRFKGTPDNCEILRGGSNRTLFVTSVGIALEIAKRDIQAMYGRHRLPDLLKLADRECRGRQAEPAPNNPRS